MMLAGCFGLLRAFADHYPAFAEAITAALDA
jgi:succinate-acetate transporter protein